MYLLKLLDKLCLVESFVKKGLIFGLEIYTTYCELHNGENLTLSLHMGAPHTCRQRKGETSRIHTLHNVSFFRLPRIYIQLSYGSFSDIHRILPN